MNINDAMLYGAGLLKIGSVINPNADEETQTSLGRKAKRRFMKAVPAYKQLIEAVQKAAGRGYVKGLDGRKLHVRSAHSALNVLLQSAGALICKLWVIRIDEIMQVEGFTHGWHGDYAFSAWVHKFIVPSR